MTDGLKVQMSTEELAAGWPSVFCGMTSWPTSTRRSSESRSRSVTTR